MATSPLSVVLQHLLADLRPDGGGMTDGELLARFLRSRDDNALAALVRRHAPMVWGVCRRLLHSHHDAEDAFQATFLVLVRKAADVPRQAVANWLYGVARQTAVRLRATAAKRGRRETQVVNMPEPTVPEVRDADLQTVLDEELSRLPDHYRGVIVLCDLEGMTRKEAARQLGIPDGSVASRLARARVMLAKRLAQRGVVFSGGSVAAVLSAGSASASAPPALVASTIKAASLLAAGRAAGVVSAKVAALTDGVVKAMFATKIKGVLAVVLVVGLALGGIGVGVGLSTTPAAVAQQPGAKLDDDKKGDDKADWRVQALDEQIGKLREVQKEVEQEAATLNKRAGAIETAIGELRAQRERFLKKAAPMKDQKKGEEKPPPAKSDRDRMVGNWFIMNEDSGRKGEMWVITEGSILMHAKNLGAIANLYSHRLDSGKDPKQIDITVTRVKGQVVGVIKGLYALDGDELRLCLGALGKDRPTAFPEKPGPGEVLILQRATSGATPPKAKEEPPAKTDQERIIGVWYVVNDEGKRTGEPWFIGKDSINKTPPNHYGPPNLLYYRLDAGKDPKQIDMGNKDSIGTIKGIYALDGDELRLCLASAGKDRPAAFPKKPGPGELLILHRQKAGAEQPKAQKEQPAAKEEQKVLARLAVLRDVCTEIKAEYVKGKASFDRVQQATRALLDAELELCETGKERIAMLEKMVTLAKHNETTAEQRYKAGAAPRSDVLMATAGRLETEIALERAKSKAPARPK